MDSTCGTTPCNAIAYGGVTRCRGVTQQDSTEVADILCQKCRRVATYVVRNAREHHNSRQLHEGWMDQYDREVGGNVEEGDGELDEDLLEEAVEDENSETIMEDGEADEESEDASNSEAEVPAEGSGEESEGSSESEVDVVAEGNCEESEISEFSKTSEGSSDREVEGCSD